MANPMAYEAERSVLGGILLLCGPWPAELERLVPSHFATPTHAEAYAAMCRLRERQEPTDEITVHAEIGQTGSVPKGGWASWLRDLTNEVPTAANLGHWAGVVMRESRRRDYAEVTTRALADAAREGADADEIMMAATLRLGEIADGREAERPVPMRVLMSEELKGLDERRRAGTTLGALTGYDDLDNVLCGLVPGHLIVLAARPSMGKSSLARNILVDMALRRQKAGLLLSLEMSRSEIAQCCLATEARVNLQHVRTARLSGNEYAALAEAMSRLATDKLAIHDRPGLDIAEIRSLVRGYASRHEIGAVVIDYLQLVRGAGSAQNREQEVASITRGLKCLAMELRVPVVALSQLNRGLESRDDKRPRLSDLRESGSIEQDADEVLFIYRDEYYDPGTKDPGVAEIGIAKNRNGPTGVVRLRWDGRCTRFDSVPKDH